MATATTSDDSRARELLEQFVVGNAELQQIEALLKKFNLFEALKLVWHEVRHSDLLAYLLDPRQHHGLGDFFLKSFLQSAVKGKECSVTPIDIDLWNLSEAEVHREWQHIDIFVRDERNHVAVIIENKIGTEEHSDQLARYYECVSREFAGWKVVPIYLTVESDTPSDTRYVDFGYDRVCRVVEDVIKSHQGALNADVRVLIEHYAEMLRRHHLSESELSKLCRSIYAKHKPALDLIYEHRPDRQQMVREELERCIQANATLEPDDGTKVYIHFMPKAIDAPILKQSTGWTKSLRIMMFEAVNDSDSLSIKLYVGPGPSELRQRLLDFASRHTPPFKTPSRTGVQWSTIFTKKLLAAKSYELHDDEFIAELKQQWNRFIERDLPPIVAAIVAEEWIDCPLTRNDIQESK